MKLVMISMLTLTFLTSSTAQTASHQRNKVRSSPTTTQTATTSDGKTVLLRSDGTWEYAATSERQSTPPIIELGSVVIEAALVYRSGDVKPVARSQIFLLDADLVRILRGAGLKPVGLTASRGDTDDNLLFTFCMAMRFPSNNDFLSFYPAAVEAVKAHVKYVDSTDFSGHVTFEKIKPGSYFIYSLAETPKGFALWNLPVDVQGSVTKIILDQNNAAYAS